MDAMDDAALLAGHFEEHALTVSKALACASEPFARLADLCSASLLSGGRIFFFGNGGSAADAQHLAAELTVKFRSDRRPLAGIALTTDTSFLTACTNDYSFEAIFSRQIEALARPGDVALGISTSGNSQNVVNALESAKKIGAYAAGFAGGNGGRMSGLADPLLIAPSTFAARIQEVHILFGHALCDAIERRVLAAG